MTRGIWCGVIVFAILALCMGPSMAWAVDEIVVEELQTEVTETKAKADGNNSRIQDLEAKDTVIEADLIQKKLEILTVDGKADSTKEELVKEVAKRVVREKTVDENLAQKKLEIIAVEEKADFNKMEMLKEIAKRVEREKTVDENLAQKKLEIIAADVKASKAITDTKENAAKIAAEKTKNDEQDGKMVEMVELLAIDRGDIVKNKEDVISAMQKTSNNSTEIKNSKDAIAANTAAIATEHEHHVAGDAALEAADNALQASINAEGVTRGDGDAALQNQINAMGPHTVDTNTQLSEVEVDAFVGNNGYLTSFTESDPVAMAALEEFAVLEARIYALEQYGGTPFCGDGYLDIHEDCDDGNEINFDACTNRCKSPVCGDGIVSVTEWGYSEECDDGNLVPGDGCHNCLLDGEVPSGGDGYIPPLCGDGYIQPEFSEECDDANYINWDSCTNKCKQPICGDGILSVYLEFQEECDDGNLVPGDGCHNCLLE